MDLQVLPEAWRPLRSSNSCGCGQPFPGGAGVQLGLEAAQSQQRQDPMVLSEGSPPDHLLLRVSSLLWFQKEMQGTQALFLRRFTF